MRNPQEYNGSPSNPSILHSRCIELLQRESHRPLLALTAPMGYGKTTLLEAWARTLAADHAVGWLTLDKEDNDLRHLLSRLIPALPLTDHDLRKKRIPQLDGEESARLKPPQRVLVDSIVQALNVQHEVHLFFDCYEMIQDAAVHDTFAYLISQSGKHVHYYIASREKLPFFTSIRTSHPGPLAITHDHLKLNPSEMKRLVHLRTRVQLQADELLRLDQMTEGWPFALELFATLADGSRAEPLRIQEAIDTVQSAVQGALLDNILLRQPEQLQQFMLRTSIPEFFDAELSLLLTEDPSYNIHLEQLMHKSLFLFHDKNGHYRYHTLFARLLRTRFKEFDRSGYVAMQERISLWSEKNGFLLEAVQHALLIPDYERASALLLGDITATVSYPRQSLIRLLDQFPSMEIARRHSIAMVYAWLLTAEHRIAAAETVLDQSEALMTEEDYLFAPTGEDLRGYIASIRSQIHFIHRDTERGMALMQETATRLSGAGYLYNHINTLDPCGSSLLKSNVGYWGAIDQSIAVYGYAEPLWSGVNQGYGIIHAVLGECYYERNQLTEAEKSLLIGRRVGLDLRDEGIILPATLTLVQLKWALGEQQAAQILLDETRKLIANGDPDSGVIVLDACQARLHIQADQPGPVRKWFRHQSPDAYGVLDIRYVYEYLTLLRAHAFLGSFRHGITFGERLLQFSQSWYLHYYVAEIHLLLAILYEGDGDRNTAFHRLDGAMEIAHKEGYIQLFLAEWKPAEQLLDKYGKHIRLKKTKPAQEILAFYDRLIQYRSEQELSADKDQFAQKQLTAKEYKVLQALIAGKSNAVIADELSVKLETVKTHCKNIYKKLHLKSRKAVLRHFTDS